MTIYRLVLNRIAVSIPLLFVVSALTFVLLSLVPGDAARMIVGDLGTQAEYEAVRQQLGLNDPVYIQYWNWLSALAQGDLGASLFTNEPVVQMLNARIPISLSLIVLGTFFSGLLGIGLGMLSALRGGWLAKLVDGLAMFGLAVPSFWVGLVLIAIFAVGLRLFPVIGYVPLTQSLTGWLHALALPVFALTLHSTAVIAKQTRDSVLDTLSRDFIRVMQANGFSNSSILFRHVLRNSSISIITVLGLVFIHLLTGALFVEVVFALPGIASLIQHATLQHDVPVIQGAMLYVTIFVVVVNLAVDLIYGLVDPRVRLQ